MNDEKTDSQEGVKKTVADIINSNPTLILIALLMSGGAIGFGGGAALSPRATDPVYIQRLEATLDKIQDSLIKIQYRDEAMDSRIDTLDARIDTLEACKARWEGVWQRMQDKVLTP